MVEILIAVAIIVISTLAAMSVSSKSISTAQRAVHITQANFLLEEGAEAARIIRDGGWTGVSNLITSTNYYFVWSGGTWTASTTPSTIGIFTRTTTVSPVNRDATTQDISPTGVNDPGTKLITITVSWPEGGNTVSKNLKFYLSNIFQ